MIPPERRDTTNVRPDEFSRREAARTNTVQREFNRNDFVPVAVQPAPVNVPRLTPTTIRASALPSSRKTPVATPAPEPAYAAERRESNQLRSSANIQALETALNTAINDRVQSLMNKRQVASLMGALSPNQAIGNSLSKSMVDAYSTRVYAQVDALVKIGMDREIALQRMLDKVNNGSFGIMFDQMQGLSKLLRWGIGLLLAYWIFF